MTTAPAEGQEDAAGPVGSGAAGEAIFVPTEAETELFDELADVVDEFVANLAGGFCGVGSAPMVAASLAADLAVRSAWKLAAMTRIAEGGANPNPANFIAVATNATKRFLFDADAIRAGYAAPDFEIEDVA